MNATERIEHDLPGDRAVPAAAYYGVHTLRALENFPIIGYANATDVAREALATGGRVADIVLARGLMTREQLEAAPRPEVLTRPHLATLGKSERGAP